MPSRAKAAYREPPPAGTHGLYRLGDLVATPLNIRTDPRTPEDVRAMAQSILFHGRILQNLVLVPELDEDGHWTGKLGAVWKGTPQWQRSAHHLRRLVTKDQISLARDPLGRFVGASAYEQAGGTVLRDLFSDEQEGFVADRLLLQQLAQDKLDTIAAKVRTEGWAWVEARTQFDSADRSAFAQCALTRRKVPPEDAKTLQALGEQLQALQARLRKGDDSTALRAQCRTLQAQIAAVEGGRYTVAEVSKPFAGAVVCVDSTGNVEIVRGIVKPEDRKAHAKAVKAAEAAREKRKAQAAAPAPEGCAGEGGPVAPSDAEDGTETQVSEISRPLSLRLGAQRTAALQALLARNTALALACLTHTLVADVFCRAPHHRDPLQIPHVQAGGAGDRRLVAGQWPRLDRLQWHRRRACGHADGDQVEQLRLRQRLQPAEDLLIVFRQARFPRLLLLGELAVRRCLLDRRVGTHQGIARTGPGTDWWQPTGVSFLGSVSKAQVVALVREVAGADACAGLDKGAKAEMVAKAEALLQGKGWLHPLLQVPADGQD